KIVLNTSSGANKYIGGLAGYFRNGYISNSYNIGNISTNYKEVAGIGSIIGKSGSTVNNVFYLQGTVDKINSPGEELSGIKLKSVETLSLLNQGNNMWIPDLN